MKFINFNKLFFVFFLINFQQTIPCCSSPYKYNDYVIAKALEHKVIIALADILKYLENNRFYQCFDELINNLESRKKYLKNFTEFMQDMPSIKNLGNIAMINLIVNNYLLAIQAEKELLKENHSESRYALLKKMALAAIQLKDNIPLNEIIETYEIHMKAKTQCCAYCCLCCCCLTDSCKQCCAVSYIQNDCNCAIL